MLTFPPARSTWQAFGLGRVVGLGMSQRFDIPDISMFLLAYSPSALAAAAGAIPAAVLWIDFHTPDLRDQ